jgi:hypothetical protein
MLCSSNAIQAVRSQLIQPIVLQQPSSSSTEWSTDCALHDDLPIRPVYPIGNRHPHGGSGQVELTRRIVFLLTQAKSARWCQHEHYFCILCRQLGSRRRPCRAHDPDLRAARRLSRRRERRSYQYLFCAQTDHDSSDSHKGRSS